MAYINYKKVSEVKSILHNIFMSYIPNDRKEISYNELAEVLVEIKYILEGNLQYTTSRYETVQFLGLFEKLGILRDDQRRYLQRLKVLRNDKEFNTGYFIFSDSNEQITLSLCGETDFIDKESKELLYKLYATDPFKLELLDPQETLE